MSEQDPRKLFEAIHAGCGAIVHMSFGMQDSATSFKGITSDDGTCQRLAAGLIGQLETALVGVNDIMQQIGDYMNGGDAAEPDDEMLTGGAFSFVSYVLHGEIARSAADGDDDKLDFEK